MMVVAGECWGVFTKGGDGTAKDISGSHKNKVFRKKTSFLEVDHIKTDMSFMYLTYYRLNNK